MNTGQTSPLDAIYWNTALGVSCGDEIATLLANICTGPIALRPEVPDSTDTVKQALAPFPYPVDRVHTLSTQAMTHGMELLRNALPKVLFDPIDFRFSLGAETSVHVGLWYHFSPLILHHRFQSLLQNDRYSTLSWGVRAALEITGTTLNCPACIAAGILANENFEHLVAYEIAFIATTSDEYDGEVSPARPFIDLVTAGNFPLGHLRRDQEDGSQTFLVLVA